jgi:hypothetical protein
VSNNYATTEPRHTEAPKTITYEGETTMSKNTVARELEVLESASISAQLVMQRRMEELRERLTAFDNWPEDEYPEETVMLMLVKYNTSDKVYTYTLLKSIGKWFVSGRGNHNYKTWEEIAELFADKVTELWIVTGWEQVL